VAPGAVSGFGRPGASDMDYSRPDLADRLAADYVAGTLRGPARRRFEALLPAHANLRAAVQAWHEQLMPLTASIPPVQPPPEVWQRIEARLDARAARGRPSTPAAAAAAPLASWWAQLAFWRGLSAFATVAAVGLGLLLAVPEPSRAPVIVVLNAAAAGDAPGVPASIIASISGDGRALVTRPLLNVNVEADRALELWAVPPAGAPRSLGLISAAGATVVRRDQILEGTAALAVSLEPRGGSPTGAPTGPILYVGKLTL
jgi:anti-sigma-K factor RskA